MSQTRRDLLRSERTVPARPPLILGFTLALVAAITLAIIVSVIFWIAAALLVGAALLYAALNLRRPSNR